MMSEAHRLRVLVHAPIGRDGPAAAEVLCRAGLKAQACTTLAELTEQMQQGVAAVVLAEEGLFDKNIDALSSWIEHQSPWSDLPFVVLASHINQAAITAWRQQIAATLQNVSFIERPIQALTLISAVQTAVRARIRQYEIAALLEAQRRWAQNLEQLVAARTQQLADANQELIREMAERARAEESLRQAQKIEAVGQLTGGVAHDFNNLLMVVQAGLDMLKRENRAERRELLMEGMRRAVERGAGLTRQLLAFSRRQPLQPRPVKLATQLKEMRELLERSLRADIRLDFDIAENLWFVEIDPGEFELVILNLVVNARDAMKADGFIKIQVENVLDASEVGLPGEHVRLSIADSGSGMTEEVKRHVFEPFFTTKEVGKGSGLGLAQVYGFAKQSGGSVRIDSELGRGTTVALYLPRSVKRPSVEQGGLSTADNKELSGRSGRVLLVEDNDEVATFVAQMLSQLGYEVMRAETAHAALGTLADDRNIDIVFTDIIMPGAMNGIELLNEIRLRRPTLPVLLTSGYAGAPQQSDPDYEILRKPYQLRDLADALDAAFSKMRMDRPAKQHEFAGSDASRFELD